jgi:hypothetical protein
MQPLCSLYAASAKPLLSPYQASLSLYCVSVAPLIRARIAPRVHLRRCGGPTPACRDGSKMAPSNAWRYWQTERRVCLRRWQAAYLLLTKHYFTTDTGPNMCGRLVLCRVQLEEWRKTTSQQERKEPTAGQEKEDTHRA